MAAQAVEAGEVGQLVRDLHLGVQAPFLRHVAHQATVIGVHGDLLTVLNPQDLAFIANQGTHNDTHGSGLARTIGTHEAYDLTVVNMEVKVVEGSEGAIVLGKTGNTDHMISPGLGSWNGRYGNDRHHVRTSSRRRSLSWSASAARRRAAPGARSGSRPPVRGRPRPYGAVPTPGGHGPGPRGSSSPVRRHPVRSGCARRAGPLATRPLAAPLPWTSRNRAAPRQPAGRARPR